METDTTTSLLICGAYILVGNTDKKQANLLINTILLNNGKFQRESNKGVFTPSEAEDILLMDGQESSVSVNHVSGHKKNAEKPIA